MAAERTPTGQRLHIAFFGRRNAGKSSLINALSRQAVSLVSPVPGTTTDPVRRPMELHPLGPVVLIDTAGIDDEGDLGRLRVERSFQVLDQTDLAVLAVPAGDEPGEAEERMVAELKRRGTPAVGAVTKADLDPAGARRQAARLEERFGFSFCACSCIGQPGVAELRQRIIAATPVAPTEVPLLADLVRPGDLIVLVVPLDSGAPKGRLILPQVQAIREVLDAGGIAVTVRDRELPDALKSLGRRPALVVTDSQVFGTVNRAVPPEIPITSFSILMARHKGDLAELVRGAQAIDRLRPGDRVLIAETCTHHQQKDDIGTVKIPRWLRERVGGELQFEWAHGGEMPEDLSPYRLIVHCGGCMVNRRLMLSRIRRAQAAGVPIVNYGVCIAHQNGILPRALTPFREQGGMSGGNGG
ncbi:[FeFe] hydrogenase H-cluster maturation GTPase HydF [Symbiobacterium thermophilum]|uniref:[FeFe] hydrogenase H-cluster maturation GTPase HydF n=1 Tax=Symbiobacterium thermophilum TaxID=2734 RepID=A0A953I6V0_SYMTR|nr:[FeFe] hydrogenase H-cluster maturation GTPase HydF [Symbiobacterium thermophilum]MBY6275039.1 [FeFe] hydrogenase H-cluster maturation GTPase HydF [Symbiobacterium thermophilum]